MKKEEPGFFTRLGEVLNGTAQKKIRRSIREQREMDQRMGRAVVPVEKKRRKTAKRKPVAPCIETSWQYVWFLEQEV